MTVHEGEAYVEIKRTRDWWVRSAVPWVALIVAVVALLVAL